MPSLPAVSVTLTFRVLLPVSVTPLRLQAVEPTVAVAAVQVVPLSSDTFTVLPVSRLDDSVPLTVCAAVLVMKSVLLEPVSFENEAAAIVIAGAVVSSVTLSPALRPLI